MNSAFRIGAALTLLLACGPPEVAGEAEDTDTSSSGGTTAIPLPEATGESSESGEAPPPPSGEGCTQTDWGTWQQEASLPGDALSARLHSDPLEVVVLGAGTSDDPLAPVYAWLGPGQPWEARQPAPLSTAVSASARLTDGRLLLLGDDEPRSVLRSVGDTWEHLGTLTLEPGRIVLGQTSVGSLVVYHPSSGELSVSVDDGESWTALPAAPRPSHSQDHFRMDPFGPVAVLVSGPGVVFGYEVALGESIPTGYPRLPYATASAPWPDDRRFAIDLGLARDADQSEIAQVSPRAALYDKEGDGQSLNGPCSPPVVTEYMGLEYQLLTVGEGRVALWGGAASDFTGKQLSIYDEDIGWAKAPMPGDSTHARLTMLSDGSILAVGVDSPEQVWRWAPD